MGTDLYISPDNKVQVTKYYGGELRGTCVDVTKWTGIEKGDTVTLHVSAFVAMCVESILNTDYKKLYLIERTDDNATWESYTAAVVCAFSEYEARGTHPCTEFPRKVLPLDKCEAYRKVWELEAADKEHDEELLKEADRWYYEESDDSSEWANGRDWPKWADQVKATCIGIAHPDTPRGAVLTKQNSA